LLISVEAFNAMPHAERVLAVSVGHAINELNVLRKLVLLSSTLDPSGGKWQRDAQTCQLLVLTRTLTGKLFESWQVVRKTYFDSRLSLVYRDRVNADGTEALQRLGKYFGRGESTIESIRNKFAFHYSSRHLSNASADATDADELSLYFSESSGNVLYYFAEHIAGGALLQSVNSRSMSVAFGTLLSEIARVVADFNAFGQSVIAAIVDHVLPSGEESLSAKEVANHEIPHASSVQIPFYVDFQGFPPPPKSDA
jgi:hypothetical protein